MPKIWLKGSAIYSEDKLHRYVLDRWWGTDKYVMFISLNPSTATEDKDDATIHRDVVFANSWGYGRLVKGNIFAFRATDQEDLYKADDPVGPENDLYLLKLAKEADKVIMASGKVKPKFRKQWLTRLRAVVKLLLDNDIELNVLELTEDGFPKHPLYLKAVTTPKIWETARWIL